MGVQLNLAMFGVSDNEMEKVKDLFEILANNGLFIKVPAQNGVRLLARQELEPLDYIYFFTDKITKATIGWRSKKETATATFSTATFQAKEYDATYVIEAVLHGNILGYETEISAWIRKTPGVTLIIRTKKNGKVIKRARAEFEEIKIPEQSINKLIKQ